MIKNYLKIAFRNLRKNPGHSLINIGGLAVGITACLLIARYVSYETSYDGFHEKADQLYRVTVDLYKKGELKSQSARVAPAVAPSFKAEIPDIENYTRMIILGDDGVVTHDDKAVGESKMYLADGSFFNLFSLPLVQGDENTALSKPFTVVLSQQISAAIFGKENPVGKSVVINADNFDGQSIPFEVTGVMQKIPANSHITPNVLISYPTLYQFVGHQFDNSWGWNETYTYLQLNNQADPSSVEAKLPAIFQKLNEQQEGTEWRYRLQPITNIHLYSDLQYEAGPNGNAVYVYFLAIVGFLILTVGYINYLNLTTVKTIQRAEEVGVRKVAGAQRGELVVQFLTESLMINLLAMAVAIVFYELLSPWLAALFDLPIDHQVQANGNYWFLFGSLILVLMAGSSLYPAYIISRYSPADVLMGSFSKSLPGSSLRKILVAGQFATFVVLVAIAFTVYKQVDYMKNQDLGFNSENIVVIKAPKSVSDLNEHAFTLFRNEISSLTNVVHVSGSGVVPGEEIYRYSDRVGMNQQKVAGVFSLLPVEPGYFDQFGIPLLAGEPFRNASREIWIINEEALKLLGFDRPSEAIGQSLIIDEMEGEIKGVAKNYHHENLKLAMEPILFFATDDPNYYSVRIKSAGAGTTLAALKMTYEKLFPGSPYQYFFLQDFYNQKYRAEEQFGLLFGIFSVLATIVAFIGLFGLTSYSAQLRTKEIGIRKVMGASITHIVILLSKNFLKLVVLGFLFAVPVSWYIMNRWLQDFAYRIEIGPGVFLLAGGTAVLIAIVTVSWQSVKAALMNPVNSLRSE